MIVKNFTPGTLRDARTEFHNLVSRFSGTNDHHQVTQALENLESVLNELAKRGMLFDRPDEKRVTLHGNNDALEETFRAQDAQDAQFARVVVAKDGLMILQFAIPFLKKLGNRCLEVAGKDAVRIACAPEQREGTGWDGKPFKPIPSEFTLPPGYEPSLGEKIKNAVVKR